MKSTAEDVDLIPVTIAVEFVIPWSLVKDVQSSEAHERALGFVESVRASKASAESEKERSDR